MRRWLEVTTSTAAALVALILLASCGSGRADADGHKTITIAAMVIPVAGEADVYELSADAREGSDRYPTIMNGSTNLLSVRAKLGQPAVTVTDPKTQAVEMLLVQQTGNMIVAIYEIQLPNGGLIYQSRGSAVVGTR